MSDHANSPEPGTTVLVVDDDADIRFLTQLALESTTTWTVLTASDGAEAVATSQRDHPDAVLMDLMMPDMDGLTALAQLRAGSGTTDIPVIMFTAKGVQPGHPAPWDGSDVAGVIEKPYDPLTLGERVAVMLGWQ